MVIFSLKKIKKIGSKDVLRLSVGFWGSSSMLYLIPQGERQFHSEKTKRKILLFLGYESGKENPLMCQGSCFSPTLSRFFNRKYQLRLGAFL